MKATRLGINLLSPLRDALRASQMCHIMTAIISTSKGGVCGSDGTSGRRFVPLVLPSHFSRTRKKRKPPPLVFSVFSLPYQTYPFPQKNIKHTLSNSHRGLGLTPILSVPPPPPPSRSHAAAASSRSRTPAPPLSHTRRLLPA